MGDTKSGRLANIMETVNADLAKATKAAEAFGRTGDEVAQDALLVVLVRHTERAARLGRDAMQLLPFEVGAERAEAALRATVGDAKAAVAAGDVDGAEAGLVEVDAALRAAKGADSTARGVRNGQVERAAGAGEDAE